MKNSNFLLLVQMRNMERLKRTEERVNKILRPLPDYSSLWDKIDTTGLLQPVDYSGYFTISYDHITIEKSGMLIGDSDLTPVIRYANTVDCKYIAYWKNGLIITIWKKDINTGVWDEI